MPGCNEHTLDKRCPAMLEGSNRRERAELFWDYVQRVFGTPGATALDQTGGETHSLRLIHSTGHDHFGMFHSANSFDACFGGLDAQTDTTASTAEWFADLGGAGLEGTSGGGCLVRNHDLLDAAMANINAVCCADPSAGCDADHPMPQRCSAACRATFLPYWDTCGGVVEDPETPGMFDAFADLCRDEGGEAPAAGLCEVKKLLPLLLSCSAASAAPGGHDCRRSCDPAAIRVAAGSCGRGGGLARTLGGLLQQLAADAAGCTSAAPRAAGCTAAHIESAVVGGVAQLEMGVRHQEQPGPRQLATLLPIYEECARRPALGCPAAAGLRWVSAVVEAHLAAEEARACRSASVQQALLVLVTAGCGALGSWARLEQASQPGCAAALLPVLDRCGPAVWPSGLPAGLAAAAAGWQAAEGQLELLEQVTTDPRWFCNEGGGGSSFYDKCEACVGPPICCDYSLARVSTSRRHLGPDGVTAGRRCTPTGDNSRRDDSHCDDVDMIPTACPDPTEPAPEEPPPPPPPVNGPPAPLHTHLVCSHLFQLLH